MRKIAGVTLKNCYSGRKKRLKERSSRGKRKGGEDLFNKKRSEKGKHDAHLFKICGCGLGGERLKGIGCGGSILGT